MSSGNLSILAKNLKQAPAGFVALASSVQANMGILSKFRTRQAEHAPEDHKNQAEMWDTNYWKRHLSQHKNMWVDKELSQHISQAEMAKLWHFKQDSYKMAHVAAPLFLFGGYAVPFYTLWFGNDLWQPSTMPQTPEALAEWRACQDSQRYKYIPASLASYKFWLEGCINIPEGYHAQWEECFEKNDVRRDPVKVAGFHRVMEAYQPFHLIRRQQARQLGRAMNIPTFPTLGKICLQTRVKDLWEIAFNEDHMVIAGKLHESMSDADLYDYAWRRFLAPYDKNLSREQLLVRVNDYHAFLGPRFVEEGQAPNLFIVNAYCMGYYNDPAYLEGDIAELDNNDFDNVAHFTKDAFLQRLEFENGPLRDQVEAHGARKLAENKAKLDAVDEKMYGKQEALNQ